MECYRCPHREDVEGGKYRHVPFEQTPCAACELRDGSGYVIAYKDDRRGIENEERESQEASGRCEEWFPVSVMAEAVTGLLSLRPHIRDVVSWRYAGMKYRDIAVLQGVSMAAVELRHRRALKKWPALKALFAEKAAKQRRRRVSQRS